MSLRTSALLPRLAAIVLVGLAATATLTYAAGQGIGTTAATPASAPVVQRTVVVPDVRNQAFVFAKGALEDAGFAWKITGSVHGFASNSVVSQSPAAGTKLIDTGAPTITLTLERTSYPQVGTPDDVAPFTATAVRRADLADRPVPAATPTTTVPAATTPAPAKAAPKPKPRPKAKAAATPQARTPDFAVPGARPEPADEVPLTVRAANLDAWLKAHPRLTDTNAKHWLYQHEWVVTGARLGWWHGAEALRTLIAVDRRAQSQWGIGAKSEAAARAALRYVEAKATS